jgi:hypothetical protein
MSKPYPEEAHQAKPSKHQHSEPALHKEKSHPLTEAPACLANSKDTLELPKLKSRPSSSRKTDIPALKTITEKDTSKEEKPKAKVTSNGTNFIIDLSTSTKDVSSKKRVLKV